MDSPHLQRDTRHSYGSSSWYHFQNQNAHSLCNYANNQEGRKYLYSTFSFGLTCHQYPWVICSMFHAKFVLCNIDTYKIHTYISVLYSIAQTLVSQISNLTARILKILLKVLCIPFRCRSSAVPQHHSSSGNQ